MARVLRLVGAEGADGTVHETVAGHLGADELDEAVRVLIEAGRRREAHAVLLKAVGGLLGFRDPSPRTRGQVRRAAAHFARAGDQKRARSLVRALGEEDGLSWHPTDSGVLPAGAAELLSAGLGPSRFSRADTPAVGSLLGGRYRLERMLFGGPLGLSYEGVDLENEQPVHLLLAPGQPPKSWSQLSVLRWLSHQNLAQIYSFGTMSGGHFVCVGSYDGGCLEQRMTAPFQHTVALHFIDQLARVLRAAHEHGCVHGAITPRSMLLTSSGIVKLAFGPVPSTENGGQDARYMAPEVLLGESPPSPASDLYSVGMCMFRLFTGTLPFESSDEGDMTRLYQQGCVVPPLSEHSETVPGAVETLTLELVRRSPSERLSSAGELCGRLHGALAELR